MVSKKNIKNYIPSFSDSQQILINKDKNIIAELSYINSEIRVLQKRLEILQRKKKDYEKQREQIQEEMEK